MQYTRLPPQLIINTDIIRLYPDRVLRRVVIGHHDGKLRPVDAVLRKLTPLGAVSGQTAYPDDYILDCEIIPGEIGEIVGYQYNQRDRYGASATEISPELTLKLRKSLPAEVTEWLTTIPKPNDHRLPAVHSIGWDGSFTSDEHRMGAAVRWLIDTDNNQPHNPDIEIACRLSGLDWSTVANSARGWPSSIQVRKYDSSSLADTHLWYVYSTETKQWRILPEGLYSAERYDAIAMHIVLVPFGDELYDRARKATVHIHMREPYIKIFVDDEMYEFKHFDYRALEKDND